MHQTSFNSLNCKFQISKPQNYIELNPQINENRKKTVKMYYHPPFYMFHSIQINNNNNAMLPYFYVLCLCCFAFIYFFLPCFSIFIFFYSQIHGKRRRKIDKIWSFFSLVFVCMQGKSKQGNEVSFSFLILLIQSFR